MEYPIPISHLNDFIFCPISIYFHEQYGDMKKELYQEEAQQKGSFVHERIDSKRYSTSKYVLQARDVFSEQYGIIGKIDTFDIRTGILTERKRRITTIYDGYVFQLYAQYFALKEMGYSVKALRLYSYIDNKTYSIERPDENELMFKKFQQLLVDYRQFDPSRFVPDNKEKCCRCIYYELCDRGL